MLLVRNQSVIIWKCIWNVFEIIVIVIIFIIIIIVIIIVLFFLLLLLLLLFGLLLEIWNLKCIENFVFYE